MVAKRHKITNVPLIKKIWDLIFFFGGGDNHIMSHFSGHFEGASSKCPLNSGTLIVNVSFSHLQYNIHKKYLFDLPNCLFYHICEFIFKLKF
jgi:hypothetical protein